MMDERLRLRVLGRCFELRCDHPLVAELAAARFDHQATASTPSHEEAAGFGLHVVVDDRPEPAADRRAWIEGLDRQTLDLIGPGIRGHADRHRRSGTLRVHPAALEDPTSFVRNYLECVVLYLATATGRTPVHAGLALRHGVAAMLAGASGAGKSTLSYGLLRAGWDVVADDTVYVDLADGGRVWSYLPDLRLDPGAGDLYPELEASPRLELPGGRSKLIVTPRRDGDCDRSRSFRGELVLFFLERPDTCTDLLRRLRPADAARRLWRERPQGFDLDPGYRGVVRALCRWPAFAIDTGHPVRACLDAVTETVRGGTR